MKNLLRPFSILVLTIQKQANLNNKKFVPLIKILKQWNRHNNVGLKSFHLELLTGMVFDEISEIVNYPQAIHDWIYYVFEWIQNNNSPFVPEPGKYYLFVDNYLYEKRANLFKVRNRLKLGLKKSEVALEKWIQGKDVWAKRLWREMFGEMFPAPIPIATKASLVPSKPPSLGRLVAPRTLRQIGQEEFPIILPPSEPSLLEVALRHQTPGRLASLLAKPTSREPNQDTKTLLELLGEKPKKPFPWS